MSINFRALFASLALLGLTLLLVIQTVKPPRPKPIDAPLDQFSAGRAHGILQDILADETPHPVGSEANARVRDRIVEKLKSLGYDPETQRVEMEMDKSDASKKIVVENILCRIPGKTDGKNVAIVAHYDSAVDGPGAADDGAGVASILEIARILKQSTPFRHPIVLLITDGEERGLWGAKAFVETNPLAKEISAVVNLEARGTSGRSMMFETGENNRELISLYATAVSSPDTSSIYNHAYRKMPNSTDFTIFKRFGITGYNLAFIGNKSLYHTSGDNLANLDRGSLQHQGENALALIRALASTDLNANSAGDMVYTDFLSWFVIRWPESWTAPLTILSILPMVLVIVDLLRKKAFSWKALLGSCLLCTTAVLFAVLLGSFSLWLLRLLPATELFWINHPWIMRSLLWAETMLAMIVFAALAGRRLNGWCVWSGIWISWAILGLAIAILLPAASYFFVLPLAFTAITVFVIRICRQTQNHVACLFAFVCMALFAALLWLKLPLALEDAFGFRYSFAITAPFAILIQTIAPAWILKKPVASTKILL